MVFLCGPLKSLSAHCRHLTAKIHSWSFSSNIRQLSVQVHLVIHWMHCLHDVLHFQDTEKYAASYVMFQSIYSSPQHISWGYLGRSYPEGSWLQKSWELDKWKLPTPSLTVMVLTKTLVLPKKFKPLFSPYFDFLFKAPLRSLVDWI